MDQTNPYRSPQTNDKIDVQHRAGTSRIGCLLLGCVVFAVVSPICWISLILAFFGDSTAYWPGFACAVPAIVFGILAARLVMALLKAALR
jgi:hypothetical protein